MVHGPDLALLLPVPLVLLLVLVLLVVVVVQVDRLMVILLHLVPRGLPVLWAVAKVGQMEKHRSSLGTIAAVQTGIEIDIEAEVEAAAGVGIGFGIDIGVG